MITPLRESLQRLKLPAVLIGLMVLALGLALDLLIF